MLTHILKNLTRRKTRTLLTTAGIAIGVAMIVALGAMGEGLRTGYLTMFSGSGADLTIMQKGAYDITISSVPEEVVQQIAQMPEIKAATGMLVGTSPRQVRRTFLCSVTIRQRSRSSALRLWLDHRWARQNQRPQRARNSGRQTGGRVAEVEGGRCLIIERRNVPHRRHL